MAVVSPVPTVPHQIERTRLRDFATSGMMESDGEIEEEPVCIDEDKIFVAVGSDLKENKLTLLWALQNFGGKQICLLHIHQREQSLMHGRFPASKLKEQEIRAFQELERLKMHKILNEYLIILSRVGVQAEKVDIEMDNIGKGIVELVAQHRVRKLVMGAAADKHYSTRMREPKSKKAIFVHQHAPRFCQIWFVCNGCLIDTREGSLCVTEKEVVPPLLLEYPNNGTGQLERLSSKSVTQGQNNHLRVSSPDHDFFGESRFVNFDSHGGRFTGLFSQDGTGGMPTPQSQEGTEGDTDKWEGISRSPSQGSGNMTWSSSEEMVETTELILVVRGEENEDWSFSPSLEKPEYSFRYSSPPNVKGGGRVTDEIYDQLEQAKAEAENSKREAFEESLKRWKAEEDFMETIRRAKTSESLYFKEMKQRKELEELLARDRQELEKIKQEDKVVGELRLAQEKRSMLESQVADSDRMVEELEEKIVSAVELLITFKKARDELQIERDNAVREAEGFKEERDELQRERDNAVREAEVLRERIKEEAASLHRLQFFSEFSFLDINEATCNFDPSLKIGEGGYGSVYRGILRRTQVAIKMLHSHGLQGHSEFQQEVEVLSRARHPNLVTLIGTCPEAWSLIYEFLPNGSLEDRLTCIDNTPPLQWQTRTRIATEICSALIFLHSNNPHCIVHGDLNPSNILLDANFVSKLSDFGISRLIPQDESSTNTTSQCRRTDPKGSFVYMDPELLATGELTPKSDVYSFGIILLQLLTGRPALGIVKVVQTALEEENLNALLDASAGDWPFVQAKQLAHLALSCCDTNRGSRPDLESEVWRVLEPMRASCGASSSFRLGSEERCQIPSYFICPIFQETMRDPHIAADGFTYEAEALRGWLDSGHNTSPMTNLKLPHCNLLPNHTLRSAIQEWLQQ